MGLWAPEPAKRVIQGHASGLNHPLRGLLYDVAAYPGLRAPTRRGALQPAHKVRMKKLGFFEPAFGRRATSEAGPPGPDGNNNAYLPARSQVSAIRDTV